MWTVEIELRTLKNKVIKRVQVNSWNTFTETITHIDDDISEDTERWVVLYANCLYTAEFRIE